MSETTRPKLRLVGEDGNAFAILARAKRALREAGREDEIQVFVQEATSGDYRHLLSVVVEWFEVD